MENMDVFDLDNIKVIAFDADDTLWDTQPYFDDVEHLSCQLLSEYGDEDSLRAEHFKTESGNMATLGFGAEAFTISLVETAIRVSGGKVRAEIIEKIITMGKTLLSIPSTPLPGVVQTLQAIRSTNRYKMVLFTKGSLMDQENKISRSGLRPLFDTVDIVSVKRVKEYADLCSSMNVKPEEFMMVGNSLPSDIHPVLEIGGYGVHIPYHITWQMETAERVDHPHLIELKTFSELIFLAKKLD